MLLSQNRIARLEEALALYGEYVPAVVRDFIDEIRLAREHGERLVAVNGVNRLDANVFYREGMQRLRHNQALPRNVDTGQFLEAGLRQHERALAARSQHAQCFRVAVVAVM